MCTQMLIAALSILAQNTEHIPDFHQLLKRQTHCGLFIKSLLFSKKKKKKERKKKNEVVFKVTTWMYLKSSGLREGSQTCFITPFI